MCYTSHCGTYVLISTRVPFSTPYHHNPLPLAPLEARGMSPSHSSISHRPSQPEQNAPNLIRDHPRAVHRSGSARVGASGGPAQRSPSESFRGGRPSPRNAQPTPIPPDVAALPKSGKNGTPPTLASHGLQPCPHRAPALQGRDNTRSHFRQKRQCPQRDSPKNAHHLEKTAKSATPHISLCSLCPLWLIL